MIQAKPTNLLNNSRFYILAGSLLVGAVVAAYLRLSIPSDQLYYIRLQQIYGLICLGYWYGALIISPLGYVIGKQRLKHVEFARRAIGVSAAYFALLHAAVALWGQLGGIDQLALLPGLFQWSLTGGAIGLVILLIMAATSFDRVVARMTYRRWKWLHRLVYAGLIVVILHIWTIGTHLAYPSVQWISFAALVVLSGLEMFRVTTLLLKKYPLLGGRDYFAVIFLTLWAVWIVLIAALPAMVGNYHSQHTDHNQAARQHEVHDE